MNNRIVIHKFDDTEAAYRLAKRYFMIRWEDREESDCVATDDEFHLIILRRLPIIHVN